MVGHGPIFISRVQFGTLQVKVIGFDRLVESACRFLPSDLVGPYSAVLLGMDLIEDLSLPGALYVRQVGNCNNLGCEFCEARLKVNNPLVGNKLKS